MIFLVNYTLTMESATGGSIDPAAGANVYASGTEVTATATASTGYRFEYWLRNGLRTNLPNPYVFNITKNLTLTPVFIVPGTDTLNEIAEAETESHGTYLGVPGLFLQGMDNFECDTRTAIQEAENET